MALVTGASSGIGEETARLLHEAGFTTYAVARRVDRMAALEKAGVHTFAMDVTDDASMVAGINRIVVDKGRIDVLVNNAGYGSYGAVEDVPIDEARRQFEVNVFGLARLTQLVTPTMREQGAGRIINVSSIGGKFYEPLGAWYHATKFAVEGFSDSLRLELAPFGIQVVIIEPGPIVTEWNTISRDSLVETSRGGAYEERAGRVRETMERGDTGWAGTQPVVVARKILKAATTSHPRARYPVGKGAGSIVLARRLMPDRAFDAMISTMYLRSGPCPTEPAVLTRCRSRHVSRARRTGEQLSRRRARCVPAPRGATGRRRELPRADGDPGVQPPRHRARRPSRRHNLVDVLGNRCPSAGPFEQPPHRRTCHVVIERASQTASQTGPPHLPRGGGAEPASCGAALDPTGRRRPRTSDHTTRTPSARVPAPAASARRRSSSRRRAP